MKPYKNYILSATALLAAGYGTDVLAGSMQGYWKASSPFYAIPTLEFFEGPTATSEDMSLKTGRIEKQDGSEELFYWNENSDGSVHLTIVSEDCPTRPLSTCATIANADIQASQIGRHLSFWDVSYDSLTNDSEDFVYRSVYKKNKLKLNRVSNGDVFLNSVINPAFSSPYLASKSRSDLSIKLNLLGTSIEATANLRSDEQDEVLFFNVPEMAHVETVNTFQTLDGQSIELNVVSSVSSVSLVASEHKNATEGSARDGNYVLSWVISNTVQFPEGMAPESVDLSGFAEEERFSEKLELFDKFIRGPRLGNGDLYFSHFPGGFSTADGFANELSFINDHDGIVSYSSATDSTQGEEKPFSWQQKRRGGVGFELENATVDMQFLAKIDGGYRVLFSKENPGTETEYYIRDFIRSANPVINALTLPGEYQILNTINKPSGSPLYDIVFNDDGSMGGDVSGYWFEDSDGSILSYECYDLMGGVINDYYSCLSAVDSGAYGFAWIRRLLFIHQDGHGHGNNFKVKYNSVIHSPFSPAPENYSWTYRITRNQDDALSWKWPK